MLLHLQKYDIIVQYKHGTEMHIADTLSHAYLPYKKKDTIRYSSDVNMIEELPFTQGRLKSIKNNTKLDEKLQPLIMVG